MPKRDYYAVLGLEKGASEEDIKNTLLELGLTPVAKKQVNQLSKGFQLSALSAATALS